MSDGITDGARAGREAQEKREVFFRLFQCFISGIPKEHQDEGDNVLRQAFLRKDPGDGFSANEISKVTRLLSSKRNTESASKREWVRFICELYRWGLSTREGVLSFIRKVWPFDKDALILGIGGFSKYDTSFNPEHTYYALGQRELIQSLSCYTEIDFSDFEVFKKQNPSHEDAEDIYFIAVFSNNKLIYYFG